MIGPYKITFGKDRYHEHQLMEAWCRQYLGEGGWYAASVDKMPDDFNWAMDQLFGSTTFRFRNAKDYSKFIVKWEWANGSNRTG